MRVGQTFTLGEPVDGIPPSDHDAVVADLMLTD